MNILEQCIDSFEKMIPIRYHFQISRKKKISEIYIDFMESDFKHLVGLQYLKDISMSRNSKKVYQAIKDKKITFEKIEKSAFFEKIDGTYANVKERMTYFPMLNEFIESDNIIFKYVRKKNPYSRIDADYMIESTVREITVYIFLKRRSNDSEKSSYAAVSFFLKDKVEYRGEDRYWMLKEKITNEGTEIIYQRDT